MNIRKIGVVGGFVAGAALALAPLASADSAGTGVDWGQILASEIASMNSMFGNAAELTGFDTDLITQNSEGFDTITQAQLAGNEAFGQFLYGVNWETEMGNPPGSYGLFNGALTQFTDGNNVLLYGLLNNGGQIDAADYDDFLFGGHGSIVAALAGENFWEDAGNFYMNGLNDILGYFDVPSLDV